MAKPFSTTCGTNSREGIPEGETGDRTMSTTAERIIQIVTPLTEVIELLVLGCSADDANQYARTLRNSGMAIHLATANTQEELDRFLETSRTDLVLVNCDAEEIDFTTAIRQIRRRSPLASFVLLSDDPAEELFFAAETNAHDIIQRNDSAHLIYVVNREQQNMVTRHRLEEAEKRAQEAEARWRLLTESMEEPVAYIHEGVHIHANRAYLELFGYDSAEELEGLPFMDLVAAEDRLRFKPVLRQLEKEHTAENIQVDCTTANGRTIPVEMRFAPARIDGEACTQVIVTDRSSRARLDPEDLTHYDIETGLYNRAYFLEQLEERLRAGRSEGERMGLVLFSVDNYRELVEEAGADPALGLLRELSRALKESTYDSDLVARYGEHEFALLCTPSTDARAVAERLVTRMRELARDFSPEPALFAGLAFTDTPPVHSTNDLLHNANRARRHAAQTGEALVLYDESLQEAAPSQEEVDRELVRLIDRAMEEEGRLIPFYQPVVSLHGNSREHYVVYLRLRGDDGELLVPGDFLPDADKTERMADLDRWVIRRAIQELSAQREEGHRVNFFINLSAQAVTDDSLLLWICDCLREFKAKGAWLTFVIAQHDAMRYLDTVEQLVEGLKKINCRIALSHFSFEQEAVNLVRHLGVDVVYFETSTAANISRDKEYRELLQSYNEQLQKEGVKTVVTHIEEAAQLALLWNIGVDYIQGNFIQEPADSIVYDAEL